MLKDVYKRLGLEASLEEEQGKFINRMLLIFKEIDSNHLLYTGGVDNDLLELLNEISFILGEKREYRLTNLLTVSRTIEKVIIILEAVLSTLKEVPAFMEDYSYLQQRIVDSLNLSVIDLGIHFHNDKFYKKGAQELDERLLLEPLEWLAKYPKAKEYFSGALTEMLKNDFPDAITKAYSSLESIVKTVLGNNKNLKDSISELLKSLDLPTQWGNIIFNFCSYAHDFSSRHGKSEKRKGAQEKIEMEIAEAYIYFTGLVIRLIISN